MKGFALDEFGDVILTNEGIQMIEGAELLCQTCRQVIGTNQGEWFLNGAEGICFNHVLTKRPDQALVRDEIQGGLYQVDGTLSIDDFTMNLDEKRRLSVRFRAKNSDGVSVDGGTIYDNQ